MDNEQRAKLRSYSWMESRIPALDALTGFIPSNLPIPPDIQKTLDAIKGPARWYPVEGGHRVVIRDFEGLPYDGDFFEVEKGAWDHEHCDACEAQIPPMTLCYVTMPKEPYVLLCMECFKEAVPSA